MKLSLNWLKDYVSVKDSPETIARGLTMAGLEVKSSKPAGPDAVFEIEITTNRPDWLSHIGVAREIHAAMGGKFSLPPAENKIPRTKNDTLTVTIPEPDRKMCPYYSACLLEDVEWQDTPAFIKERLEACGIRSINFPVDITNFVLLEIGQPLHAFDFDKLSGGQIYARRAHSGEKLVAIDGKTYDLEPADLIIADNEKPVAIGGVMGGQESEVNDRTRNILLESAFFEPSVVRKSPRRLKLVSESSYRFERRVDPRTVDWGRERAVYLFRKYAKVGRVSLVCSVGKLPINEPSVKFEYNLLKKAVGIDIPPNKVNGYFSRLGLKVLKKTKTGVTVKIPSFRSSDLTRPVDLVEEVARLYGYDRIPETLPKMFPMKPVVNPMLALEKRVRTLSNALGLFETVTFSLVDPVPYERLGLNKSQWVQLINPQNKEWTLMRPTFLSSMIQVVEKNLNAGETSIRIFEIGNRYLLQNPVELPHEERMLAMAMSGEASEHWLEPKRKISFYDLKGAVEEILKQLAIRAVFKPIDRDSIFESGMGMNVEIEGQMTGYFGLLSKKVQALFGIEQPVLYAELSLEKMVPFSDRLRAMEELPKFPASPRDLTMIVSDSVRSEEMIEHIQKQGGILIKKVEVFDCFKGKKIPEGKKSLSYRIIYQAEDRTLQNEEVNQLHFAIVEFLRKTCGAELPI